MENSTRSIKIKYDSGYDTSGSKMMKNREMQEDEIFALKSPQRSQSLALLATAYEPAPPSRWGTWMTRIFTDMRASSVASIFYRNPSAFICVHLRLIFVSLRDRTRKIQFKLFPRSSTIPVTKYEKVAASRFGTRIARIFMDPCASVSSVQSAFYRSPSAYVSLHPRLLFNKGCGR